jgi:hypothetical protein
MWLSSANEDMTQRRPLWEVVAYGALALALLATSKPPIDANAGPPERLCASAKPPESPDSGRGNDRSRAAEHGRGRRATSPWRIPWRGWKDILSRAYKKMNDDRLLAVAGGGRLLRVACSFSRGNCIRFVVRPRR